MLNIRGEGWELEEILDSRLQNDKLEYLVKWRNQATSSNTWEMESHIQDKAPRLIIDFHHTIPAVAPRISFIEYNSLPFVPIPKNLTELNLCGALALKGV